MNGNLGVAVERPHAGYSYSRREGLKVEEEEEAICCTVYCTVQKVAISTAWSNHTSSGLRSSTCSRRVKGRG